MDALKQGKQKNIDKKLCLVYDTHSSNKIKKIF